MLTWQYAPYGTDSNPDFSLPYDDLAEGLRYDPASQVTQILHQLTATSTPINQAAYAYNPVGNRTSLTDRRGSQAFGYDTLDRLTSASHPLLAPPQAFAYDAVGNRTTGGSVVNAGNQLTADATHSYQYDDNGNLTRKTLLATGTFTQYTYDAENRLTKVEEFAAGNPTAIATSTYRYDGLGRRIEKVANGQTRRYVYDFEDILLEYDGSNVLQARYTHGPGIDEPIAVTKFGSTFFYHQDSSSTVTELTDITGTVAKSYAYDSYGSLIDQPGAVDQPYTYTGRELDAETGLYYYRARYYDATIGRFLQKDPVGVTRGANRYSYARNNPSSFIDPYGLDALGSGDIAEPWQNTIVCDGQGGIIIQVPSDISPNRLRCGVRDCKKDHENYHLEQALLRTPNFCLGKRRGAKVSTYDQVEHDTEEYIAHGIEITCLVKKLKNPPCGCNDTLEKELSDISDEREKYRRRLPGPPPR